MKAWNTLLSFLDHELGKEAVDRWLRPLKVVKFDAGNLYLDAENSFQIHWFQEYVAPYLPKHFLTARGKSINVHFSIQGKDYPPQKNRPKPIQNLGICQSQHGKFDLLKKTSFSKDRSDTEKIKAGNSDKGKPQILNRLGVTENQETFYLPDPLEPHATFESFMPLVEESLPLKILLELTQGSLPLGDYNPIYIYGPKGSGKSHLLMATAKKFEEKGKRCFYVHADTFTEHVIRAFRSASLQEFRKAYRAIEVLIIDDVHLLSRKIATQEELFHTFNRLHTTGLQIILGSSHPPHMLEDIEERLVSRFEWGITLPTLSPCDKKRIEILEARATLLHLHLGESVKEFLLNSFKNLHTLIQALQALALRLPATTTSPDLEIAQYHLKDLADKELEISLTPEKILKAVANTFGIKIEDILGRGQNKEYALPRQISMYLCRDKLNLPYPKIGRLFSRDHSTAITSVKRVKKGIKEKEDEFLRPLHEIQKLIS